MGNQWFHHIEDKLAAYKLLSASLDLKNPPRIYSCFYDVAVLSILVPPEGIEGFVVRATGLHSNNGIFVLPNGFKGSTELIRDMKMAAEDIVSALLTLEIKTYLTQASPLR
jgi:hypothetical protein